MYIFIRILYINNNHYIIYFIYFKCNYLSSIVEQLSVLSDTTIKANRPEC